MNANPTQRNSTRRRKISWGKRGFALVVTLSLMILLTIIAVGLLTLSSISLRASAQSSAASIARTNARLAMMLALGELQKTLGPDQAVSAPASAVVAKAEQPHLTGAWQADQDLAASSEGDTIWHWVPKSSDSPKYSEKQNRFKGWLVSTAKPEDAERLDFANAAAPTTGKDAVDLIGDSEDPLKDSEGVVTTVVGRKVKVASATQPGKYAWAVFDESTKAAVDLGDPKTAQSAGEEIASRTVPNRFRADVLDGKLSSLKTPENLISLETASIPDNNANVAEFRRRFHDFTTGSLGLLTDTAKGGLKKDLTSVFESDPLPNGAFDAPNTITPYPDGFTAANGAPTWKYLQNHYRKYKNLTGGAGESIYSLTSSTAKGTDLRVIRNRAATGVQPAPDVERLLPAIAKLQLVFSIVAHHQFNVPDRREFYNKNGDPKGYDPKGYEKYGVIHLVYDPVITLYNPYDVTLDLKNTRIRIWDPPVGFRFTKFDKRAGTNALFRLIGGDEAPADTDGFVGLAQFQRDQENISSARKCFTLILGTADGTNSRLLGGNWKLKPGEVKVFSPRVPDTWNWDMETGNTKGASYGMSTKGTFFDWNQAANFGNVDNRAVAIYGRFGVECAPGWDTRAGLQTDHLATDLRVPRNPASLYDFEIKANRRVGYVSIRTSDDVMVEAKPLVRSGAAVTQFQVDVLAGLSSANASGAGVSTDTSNLEEINDTLRSYRFNFTGLDPKEELSEHPEDPIIETTQNVGRILQTDTGVQTGKKTPFAMLEMSARTTKSDTNDSKPWLYNNFIVEGGEQKTSVVGLTTQSYDLRLREIQSFDGIPLDDQKRGYFGAADSIGEGGSSFVNMLHVPMAPTASLGDLIHSNLASSAVLPRVVHPFGNSRAHPLIPANRVTKTLGTMMMDHSYLLNDGLWDSYFFSSLAPYGGSKGGVMTEARSLKEVLEGVFDGTKPALNSRLVPATVPGDPAKLADTVGDLSDVERSRQVAKYVAVNGPFNVNSTSVDAWRAVLSSLRDRQVNGLEFSGQNLQATSYDSKGETPLARAGRPLADSTPPAHLRWAGIRALTDTQIEDLAKRIVEEITNRGVEDRAPSLTLGEFVNRRIDSAGGLQTLAGLLQTAIDNSNINSATDVENDSKALSAASINPKRKTGVEIEQVLDGKSAEGAPTMVTQGDLMAALAPIATVRGDTFKIRSYGEATSADGNTILARAWCEAVVQRVPDYVDPTDTAETAITALKAAPNKIFGRQFHIVSFRWLNNTEI